MNNDHKDEHITAQSTTIPAFNPIQNLLNDNSLNLFADIIHWRHS